MDILYIVGKDCSKCNDFELKMSLRSIEKYGKNVGKVYVCGWCPEYLSEEVITFPCEDIYKDTKDHGSRNANVANKLLRFLEAHPEISDEFLVSFDDNFYIREVDFDNYPHYARLLNKQVEIPEHEEGELPYRKCMANTREYLENLGLPVINFAIHRNLYVTKRAIEANKDILEKIIAEKIECDRFCLLNNWEYSQGAFDYTPVKDVKLRGGIDWWKVNPETTEVFSTCDFKPGVGLETLISTLYTEKSKYEK